MTISFTMRRQAEQVCHLARLVTYLIALAQAECVICVVNMESVM